jgi:hypothetical protein
MSKTTLMEIVNAAAERFDKRPEYRASIAGVPNLNPASPSSTNDPSSNFRRRGRERIHRRQRSEAVRIRADE